MTTVRRCSRRTLLKAGVALATPFGALSAEPAEKDLDVIVIGSGLAGLTAAVTAREAGARRVLLVEKGPLVGGHTLYASGSIAVLSPKRQDALGFCDSTDLWLEDARRAGGVVSASHLTHIATSSERAVDWLESFGIAMTKTAYQAVGDLHPRSVTALGLAAGRRYVITLHEAAMRLGVDIRLNTKVTQLLPINEAGWPGVVVRSAGRQETLRAAGVVIATGGFSANVNLRMFYDDRLMPDMPTTANPEGLYWEGAQGDGLTLGMAVGGHTVGMENIILLPITGGRLLDYVGGDIFINVEGRRFVNEALPVYDVSKAMMQQPGRRVWVITDSRSRKGASLGMKLANGTVHRSKDVREMANGMGVDPAVLQATLDEYNADARRGVDRLFGKTVFTQTIEEPPFYWGREAVGVHMTLGGLAVSTEAALLDATGRPIPGFWAAGETTGGIFGRGRPGGMSLITCLVQGRDAGRATAERAGGRG